VLRALIAATALVVAVSACSGSDEDPAPAVSGSSQPPAGITVTSTAFAAGRPIPARYSCSGDAGSPPLSWTGVPAGARELAIVVTDPDAGGYIHWVVRGVRPDTAGVATDALPDGAQAVLAYRGPCPPSGTHHYEFRVYALGPTATVPDGLTARDTIAAVRAGAVAQGLLVGTYAAG
jgi:Raf kinase inhibitor-like YbhB/YbcL family protein